MVNFQQGKIYKIVDNTNGNIYVGSTFEKTLARRLANHRAAYNSYLKNNTHFLTSFNIFKNGDYRIVLLEAYPCKSKDELKARERYYIERLDCINKNIPNRTDQQYRDDHKDEKKAYNKKYKAEHRDD